MKLLTILLFAISAYGQITINASAVTITTPEASAAIRAWMAGIGSGTITTITSNVSAVATTINVDVGVGFANGKMFSLGVEHILLVSRAGKVFTVARAQNGTTAAAYTIGAVVAEMKYQDFNNMGKKIVKEALDRVLADSPLINAPVKTAQDGVAVTLSTAIN